VVALAGERHRENLGSGWGWMLRPAMRRGWLGFGPMRGNEVTFVRYDEHYPWRDVEPRAAVAELLRRYLRVNAPATRLDFQRWIGRPSSIAAWKMLLPELDEVVVDGLRGWALHDDLATLSAPPDPEPVRLAPNFDHFLLTHIDRRHTVSDAIKARIYRTAGWVTPTVLVRGVVRGVWAVSKNGRTPSLEVELFERLGRADARALDDEKARVVEFLS
jgi:hypothetical protein